MTLSTLYIPTVARNVIACDRGSSHSSGETVTGDNVDEFTATDDTNPIKRVRGDTAAREVQQPGAEQSVWAAPFCRQRASEALHQGRLGV